MTTVKLSVNPRFYRKVKAASRACALDVVPTVKSHTNSIMATAASRAPVDTGLLVASTEVSTPRTTNTSVAISGGFTHPQAGAIHEGYHWGKQTIKPPPHFLRKAAKASKAALKSAVSASLANTISRLFPRK